MRTLTLTPLMTLAAPILNPASSAEETNPTAHVAASCILLAKKKVVEGMLEMWTDVVSP